MTIFILSNYHQHIYFQKALAVLCKNLWLTFLISTVVCAKWQFNKRISIFLPSVWRLVLMFFNLPAVLWTCHMLSTTLFNICAKNFGYSPNHSQNILYFMRLSLSYRQIRIRPRAAASSCGSCSCWRAERKKEIIGTAQRALQFCSHLETCSRKTFATPERIGVKSCNFECWPKITCSITSCYQIFYRKIIFWNIHKVLKWDKSGTCQKRVWTEL